METHRHLVDKSVYVIGAQIMTLETYDRTLNMAKRLALPEQLQLLEDLTKMIRRRVDNDPKMYDIMELEGLGAEIWQGIDAQAYVNQERM